jgi:hypothetical protein
MSDLLVKALLIIFWPLLCLACLAACAVTLVIAAVVVWPLIPFARVVRDGHKIRLRW